MYSIFLAGHPRPSPPRTIRAAGSPARGDAHRSLMPNTLALRALRSGRRAAEPAAHFARTGHWYNLDVRDWSWRRGSHAAVAGVSALLGIAVALRYWALDLTLSHYDARGHLVVARRIFDSLTPGWQQIGAVWLPLPHLLNALPVQIDGLYRTGASGVAISIASFAVATWAIAWLIAAITRSWLAACGGALVFALNPNVLYLQATPMTEPLLIAITVAAIALLLAYCDAAVEARRLDTRSVSRADAGGGAGTTASTPSSALVGWVFALACLTRYEAWPVTIGALAASVWVLWRRGITLPQSARVIAVVAVYPAVAIVGFSIFSKVVVGSWFASGFFVPENPAQGHPLEAVAQIAWGLRELSGTGVLVAAGSWLKGRSVMVALLVIVAGFELRPLNLSGPMVTEAQWDRPNISARATVTSCLRRDYAGEAVMASMGSLGHYMQDMSKAGFSIRDFLHEGNGDIWLNALHSPRPFAGWILVEEKAEGGDMLAVIARERPSFLEGYSRVCEAAGTALYRRTK